MIWLDKHGWPVEFIRNRRITNLIRWLFHARLCLSIRQRNRWQRVVCGSGLVDTWCEYDYIVDATPAEEKSDGG